ncbi:hypothetical protein HWV62_14336 [Athelia sp. TMB]|nr:hypothetical protein HWV62_14336 [Athelia sp. TMB]
MATPTAPESSGKTSTSIGAGADLLVALFEEESARIQEANILAYRTLEAQFAQCRQQKDAQLGYAMHQINEAKTAAQNAEERLEAAQAAELRALSDLGHLRQLYSAMCQEVKQAKSSSGTNSGSTGGESTTLSQPSDDIGAIDAAQTIHELRAQLDEQERARKAAEKERDELKANAIGEIAALKEKVLALQNEIAAARTGSPGMGADGQIGTVVQ